MAPWTKGAWPKCPASVPACIWVFTIESQGELPAHISDSAADSVYLFASWQRNSLAGSRCLTGELPCGRPASAQLHTCI
jgi:hypothetical protein